MATNNEKPFTPPTRKPVSEFPTPDPSVAFYTELVNRDDPAYYANSPVKRGSLYATMVGAKREVIEQYPQLFFLRERKFQLNDQLVLWDWATDENAHDTYNAEVNYIANAVTYPAFTRTYTVRRELYEAEPTVPIGFPLPGIVSVEITSPGANHTKAVGMIDETSVMIEFTVSPNGGLLSGIITNTGSEVIRNRTPITIIGDGQDSSAVAITQPVGCVLTAQKKEELPEDDPQSHELVKVTRVYETLPGPWIYATRIDKDGATVTSKTRRQVSDFIVDQDIILNGTWSQTWHKGTDDFVAEETIEERPLPGNPIVTTDVDDDGIVVTITKTLIDVRLGVSGETLIDGIWTTTQTEELASTTFVKDTSATNKVCWQVSRARAIPGNPIPSTDLDQDGVEVDISRTRKDENQIVTTEYLTGGIWTRVNSDQITDLVSWEIVKSRVIPGNPIVKTVIDDNGDIMEETRTMVAGPPTLSTTNIISDGVWTKTFGEPITELVSWKVVQVRDTQNPLNSFSVEIPDLIPVEFRSQLPVTELSATYIGEATLPVLVPGELYHENKQLDDYTYRSTARGRIGIDLPQVLANQETTEEYGGGKLWRFTILELNGANGLDEGLTIVSSKITVLDSLGPGVGLQVRETLGAQDAAWPILIGTEVDPRTGIVISVTKQVVAAGAVGGVTVDGYIDVKSIDKWRSLTIASKLDPDTLPDALTWETTVEHSFPNTLQGAVWLWALATDDCCYSFDMALETDIDEGYAGPCRARVTESFSNGPPLDVVSITQFFPKAHTIGYSWWAVGTSEDCRLCQTSARTWGIPPTLHDEITIGGSAILDNGSFTDTLPATNPIALPSPGTLITKDVNVEQWRFGVFLRRITEIYVPG